MFTKLLHLAQKSLGYKYKNILKQKKIIAMLILEKYLNAKCIKIQNINELCGLPHKEKVVYLLQN